VKIIEGDEMATAVREASTTLKDQIQDARKRTEELFSTLRSSYLYERPIRERHRVIFYVGHLDAFDYIQICREGLGHRSQEPALDDLFQAGIDPDSNSLPTDTPRDWPSPSQVDRYVAQTRAAVDQALPIAPPEAVHMSLEHRLMHLETLAYMWHNFDYAVKLAPPGANEESGGGAARENAWCDVPAGPAVLGKARDDKFGWDNEYDEYSINVPAFRIQKYKVTNGEYLRFVHEGASRPHFWAEHDGNLYWRGMFQEIPLPLDWPVYVTQREAAAYAEWIGKSLPTEEQYHRAAFGAPFGGVQKYAWGEAAPTAGRGNFDFRRWDPEPVDATPADESKFGVRQLCGNGWEWTQTVFAPFAGFQPSPSYPGYSANFFDGQHYVIKGGSPRTAARLLRRSFRNWFRPEYPYVYAGFRCVDR
jgi:formylglycine-generating enzyme required for sulfatase activity